MINKLVWQLAGSPIQARLFRVQNVLQSVESLLLVLEPWNLQPQLRPHYLEGHFGTFWYILVLFWYILVLFDTCGYFLVLFSTGRYFLLPVLVFFGNFW